MKELDTDELLNILNSTHPEDFSELVNEQKNSFIDESNDFENDFKNILKEKGIAQNELFIRADIPQKYGYRILNNERITRKRDVILRLLIAAELNLSEIQRLLHKYGMPELYVKKQRDALIILAINEKYNINQINNLLEQNSFEKLESSGQ